MSFLENNCFILCLSILLMAGCDTSSQTPQPRMITDSALPPVGIENKDSDCYLISLAQLILNSPDFLAAFKKVAHKNPIYSDLVEAYQKAQQEKTFLLTGEGSAFRKFKQYLHKLYGDDVCKPGASSAPGFVFLKIVPDILNATDNAWPPVIKTITTTTTKESGESKQESLDEYLLNYAGSDGASLDNSDSDMGQEIVKQFISREVVRFSKIPESIFFSANLAPCIKCFSFTMPNQMFNNIKEAEHGIQYKLSYFAVHIGTVDIGHYLCYMKINGIWYEAEDTHIKQIGDDEEIKKLLKPVEPQNGSIVLLRYERVRS